MWWPGLQWEIQELFSELGGARWATQLITWQTKKRRDKKGRGLYLVCPGGHRMTPENTYARKGGRKQCKTCHRGQALESYHRRKKR